MAGGEALDSWPAALGVMLRFTATAHFSTRRFDLARMMPGWFPNPLAIVYFTGVCEVMGAIELLLPATRKAAALALIVFFIVVFPANVRAARSGLTLGGKPAIPLWRRAPMQLLFIGLT